MPNDKKTPDLRWLIGAQVIVVATAIGLFIDGIVMALAVGAVAGFLLQLVFRDMKDYKLRMALNAASIYPVVAGVIFLAVGLVQGLAEKTPVLHGMALVALGVVTRAIYEYHVDEAEAAPAAAEAAPAAAEA
jgi:predicted PurR-regulated permease PerM